MNRYPPIADHGMVGDLQTAALVSSEGSVDWWCTPRFDSPSVFASLLDSERGGYCRLAADLPGGDDSARSWSPGSWLPAASARSPTS
ncbi:MULTISPECIES: trehalase-like domain-containing protein [unclassified Streptomyces]|uniref:trehalase-like domain-containing protein n=1 Tax=unclassified Streptomyces TaxID=2593676 RepID=UPI003401B1FE